MTRHPLQCTVGRPRSARPQPPQPAARWGALPALAVAEDQSRGLGSTNMPATSDTTASARRRGDGPVVGAHAGTRVRHWNEPLAAVVVTVGGSAHRRRVPCRRAGHVCGWERRLHHPSPAVPPRARRKKNKLRESHLLCRVGRGRVGWPQRAASERGYRGRLLNRMEGGVVAWAPAAATATCIGRTTAFPTAVRAAGLHRLGSPAHAYKSHVLARACLSAGAAVP